VEVLDMQTIFLITGFFLAVIGFLIWKYKVVEIMRMYNPQTCKDKDALAKWTGIRLMAAGLVSASVFFMPIHESNSNFPVFLYLGLIIAVLVVTAYGTRKFS
jgi:type III secretory pathway component EscT